MLKNLEKNLGYKFNNIKNLQKALTHSSSSNFELESNERLEFLGDKILAGVVAYIIYEYCPNKNEGYLSKFFSYLTSAEVLAEIGKKLDTYTYINQNTTLEDSVIADSVESIIAAIYIDSKNILNVTNFIKKNWDIYIKNYNEEKIYSIFNPKSTLQDWAQKNKLSIPKYIDVSKEGNEHNPIFSVKVEVEGYKSEIGKGKNKKIAQKNAAQKFIEINKIN